MKRSTIVLLSALGVVLAYVVAAVIYLGQFLV